MLHVRWQQLDQMQEKSLNFPDHWKCKTYPIINMCQSVYNHAVQLADSNELMHDSCFSLSLSYMGVVAVSRYSRIDRTGLKIICEV